MLPDSSQVSKYIFKLIKRSFGSLNSGNDNIPRLGVSSPMCSEPLRRGDPSSLWSQCSNIAVLALEIERLLLLSTGGVISEGAGGYGALCLDKRKPFRISLKNPSPP